MPIKSLTRRIESREREHHERVDDIADGHLDRHEEAAGERAREPKEAARDDAAGDDEPDIDEDGDGNIEREGQAREAPLQAGKEHAAHEGQHRHGGEDAEDHADHGAPMGHEDRAEEDAGHRTEEDAGAPGDEGMPMDHPKLRRSAPSA